MILLFKWLLFEANAYNYMRVHEHTHLIHVHLHYLCIMHIYFVDISTKQVSKHHVHVVRISLIFVFWSSGAVGSN